MKKYKGDVGRWKKKLFWSCSYYADWNPRCGDIMRIYVDIENDIIKDAKFKTFGCGAAIATSSMVT